MQKLQLQGLLSIHCLAFGMLFKRLPAAERIWGSLGMSTTCQGLRQSRRIKSTFGRRWLNINMCKIVYTYNYMLCYVMLHVHVG